VPSHARFALILGALAALGPLSIDMYLPAFPQIATALATDPARMQATLASYFAGLAIGQSCYGPAADRWGRRGPLLFGLVVYVLASVACAVASSVEALIALRFAQALGGCAGMVISRAVVRDVAEEREAVRLMSQLMLVMGLAPILAPLFGGWLLAAFGWHAIFWALALYGSAMLLVTLRLLPETLAVERRRHDSLAGILGVYLMLLRDRRYMGATLAGALTLGGMFAYIAASPFVLMELSGFSPGQYAVIFGSNAAGLILMSQVTARLVRRYAPAAMLRVALMVPVAAGLVLVASALGIGGLPLMLAALACAIGSLGMILPLSSAIAMSLHGRNAGSASALLGTLQFGLGAVAGIATGLLHDGTAMPMALVVATGGIGGFLAQRLLR
jgi:DHA1 family bicyclomycin/chloramphenicol resistance-like MFS transporter